MKLKNLFSSLIILITIIISTGCGGGGASGGNSTNTNSTTTEILLTGQFIDEKVHNLGYRTESRQGYTDNNGKFYYKVGETIEFFIGNLSLGRVTAQAIITPYTLSGDTDMYKPSIRTKNIARILQSLDDIIGDNMITISQSLNDLDISTVDLTDETDAPFLNILVKAKVKTSKNYTLKTKDEAVSIMISYLIQNNISITNQESELSSSRLPTTLEELKGNRYYVVMDRLPDNNEFDPDDPQYQSNFIVTGSTFDLAIAGKGFFKLQKSDGSFVYTRNGNFHLNSNGSIVNVNGYLLFPEITVPSSVNNLTIGMDGTISVSDISTGGSVDLGQIYLYYFPNNLGLLQVEKDLFIPTIISGENTESVPYVNHLSNLQQGILEYNYPRGIISATTFFDDYTGLRITSGLFGTVNENYIIDSPIGYFYKHDNSLYFFNEFKLLSNSTIESRLNIEIYQVTDDYTEIHIKDDNGNLIRKEYLFIDNQKRDNFYNKLIYQSNEISHNGLIYRAIASPTTGRVWLDRNLGATQVCNESRDNGKFTNDLEYIESQKKCFGDYYQWGRNTDGHEKITSLTTKIQSSSLTPNHDKFIIENNDWTMIDTNGSERTNNWNVCPTGFKIPTIDELNAETINSSSSVENRNDAFNSFLKLPTASYRYMDGNLMLDEGQISIGGWIWSSSLDTYLFPLSLVYYEFGINSRGYGTPANGQSIRCIRENSTTTYLENNLIAHYTFDNNIDNSTFYNNASTISGGPEIYQVGANGNALDFYNDDVDKTVFEANIADEMTEEFTLSFFVKVNSTFMNDLPQIYLNSSIPNTNDYYSNYIDIYTLGASGNSIDNEYWEDSFNIGESGFNQFGTEIKNLGLTNDFTHIVITRASNNIFNIYINGSYLTTKTLDNLILSPIKQIQIKNFSGQIDDLRLYNKGFNSGEVSLLYNSYNIN